MLDQSYTTVWSASTFYNFPVRNGSVSGNVVTINQFKHDLSTGDLITAIGLDDAVGYSASNTPITVIDENSFSYVLSFTPITPFPKLTVGSRIKLFIACKTYSEEMFFPRKVRVRKLLAGTTVRVETKSNIDGKTWLNQKELTIDDGEIDLMFSPQFKEARLKLLSGTIPETIAVHETALDLTPSPDNVYPIPYVAPNAGTLPDVGTPGTYDIVTTNQKGQVVSGVPVSTASNNIYTSFTNGDSFPILKGMPVRKISSSAVALANGSAGKYTVIGVAAENISVGAVGLVLIEGVLGATTAEWQLVTSVAGGLSSTGGRYFLNWTSAGLQSNINTNLAPSPSYLVAVGYAVSSTELKLEIEDPIQI
jgi:hypothetical protein